MLKSQSINYYFPKYSGWFFILLFLLCSFVYDYQSILTKPPQSLHLWRQTDCLSMTWNYYQKDASSLAPELHNLGKSGTGKTISEFPLIYYFVGQLWKIFGPHEMIYRLLVLSVFFTALLVLFRTIEEYLKDSVLSIITTLFLFSSPTLVYFANNFLVNIPAFSCAIIGLCFFLKFYHTSSNRYFFLMLLFYTIGGLLKISSLLSFMAIFSLFFLERLKLSFKTERQKIFFEPFKHGVLLTTVLLLNTAWYSYAHFYNVKYHAGAFLVGIIPIWEMELTRIKATFDAIYMHMSKSYFRWETSLFFAALFLIALVVRKGQSKLFRYLSVLIALGIFGYVMLFFLAMADHDYYTINLFIIIPVLLTGSLIWLKNSHEKIFSSTLFRILMIAFLIHNIDFARRRIETRYRPTGWQNEAYVNNLRFFLELAPKLEDFGIEPNDRVFSMSDFSTNSSLYFMNRRGWTAFGSPKTDREDLERKIKLGASYLIVNRNLDKNLSELMPLIEKKVGTFKVLDIYALKSSGRLSSLEVNS